VSFSRSYPIENAGGSEPQTHAHAFACSVIADSPCPEAGTELPCCTQGARPAHRLAVWVAQMQALPREDEAAYELAVDVLGSPAGRAPRTAHAPGCHDRGQCSPRSPVLGAGVLPVDGLAGEIAAALSAESRVRGERLELAAAEVSAPTLNGAARSDGSALIARSTWPTAVPRDRCPISGEPRRLGVQLAPPRLR
jgi:hypothetical protein